MNVRQPSLRPVAVALTFLVGLCAVAAAAPTPVPTPQPSIQLPRVLTDYEVAWRARDAAALARLFAEDGFVMSTKRLPVRGRAAIEKQYTGSGGPLVLRAFAYRTQGSTGYILGGYAVRAGESDIGKFTLTLWKDADGRWLIFSAMDNGNPR